MPTQPEGAPLAGLRVLDLTQGYAGPFGVKLLADHGADVIKVERPDRGDPMRGAGPFRDDVPDPEAGGLFLYLNTNRRGVTLDFAVAADVERFRRMVLHADLVVESFRPGTLERWGIGYEALRELNAALCMVSLSNFGSSGPYRDYELSELVAFALSGPMHWNGEAEREPQALAERATLGFAGLSLAAGALAALFAREGSGRGQHVELSITESFLAAGERQALTYAYCGDVPRRQREALRERYLVGAYPCKDGHIAVQGVGRGESWWPRVFRMMGRPELSRDPRFADGACIERNMGELQAIWGRWLMAHSRAEIFDAAAEARFPIAPVYDAADIHADPHFRARGIFREVDHPVAGPLLYPVRPFRFHGAEEAPLRPAPTLGQHDAEVLVEFGEGAAEPLPGEAPVSVEAPDLPLAGLRVLELAEGWAGPMSGMWLADLGAEVIKVEAIQRFDHARGAVEPPEGMSFYPDRVPGERAYDVNSAYVQANLNKKGLTLDLSRPRGVELFKELVALSDVVLTNMVTGVPEKMGIGFEVLSKIRPDLVMLTCSGYGASGPYAPRVTMGGAMDGIAGYSELRVLPGQSPEVLSYSMHTDVVTGMNNAVALLMALFQRRRLGLGQRVEVSGVECCLHQIPEALMDYALNGRVQPPPGNGHRRLAPHGVYPCSGEDRWIALTVCNESQWRALCGAMGNPEWVRVPQYDSTAGRVARRGELDEGIARWSRGREAHSLMRDLQALGVPAGVVQDAREHAEDPHWKARDFYVPWTVRDRGRFSLPSSPWTLDGRRSSVRRIAPRLGEHNRELLSGLLGLSDREIAELEAQRVVGDEPLPHDL